MKECSAIISKILGYRHLRRNLGMSAADRNTPKAPIGGTLGGLLDPRIADNLLPRIVTLNSS